jgi:hypothetical protein|tara:strand:- start:768 stop:1133 length:366 start_codon:yes stop_codon:yes gene_type:complete
MAYLALAFFENRCFVTHEKFKRRGFVIHHLWYLEDGKDVTRGQYPKGEKGRQDYIKALRPMVEKEPERFMLIKNGIHTRMDHVRNGLTRLKKENFERLVIAVRMTQKTKRKHNKRKRKNKS